VESPSGQGRPPTTTAPAISRPIETMRQRGCERTSSGSDRIASAASHDDSSDSVVRRVAVRRPRSTTTITPSRTRSVRPLRPVQKKMS
jgi:hypothetical protein